MVFRGKGSTACRLCRERRIKCDRHRPACSQCINVHAVCEGYRDQLDLMFHHETKSVIRRASQPRGRNTTAILRQPGHPPSVQAIGLFSSAYAGGVYLDYLPVLHLRNDRPLSLEKSFEAVALAYMATEQRRSELRQLARVSYGTALSLVKTDLRGATATTIETMASVLLLAMFVALSSSSSREARDSWSIHVRGALAMIASCSSTEAVQTPTGQYLFHHIISAVQLDCIRRGDPLPTALNSLFAASWMNEGPQAEMWAVLDRLAMLNAQPIECSRSLLHLARLQEMETDIQRLFISMPRAYPDSFTFEDHTANLPQILEHNGLQIPIHVFRSHRTAQSWNTLRLMCLAHANLLISGIASYFSFHHIIADDLATSLRQSSYRASKIAMKVAIDICASVPAIMRPGRWSDHPDARLRYSAWARSLVWPLSIAGSSQHGSEQLRGYIKEQLRVVGAVTGMRSVYEQTLDLDPAMHDCMHVTFLC